MSDNKALWLRVCVTDPKAVKEITGKQYKGNSPKPYWIVERLTDEFGPCGLGWGFSIISERFERFSDSDSLHIAAVKFWYVLDGKRGELEQIGQTKATYTSAQGKFIIDEDAPKKSVTDALVKCASYIGFAGDIFAGRWDDSKYVQEAGKEWEARKRGAAAPANDGFDLKTAVSEVKAGIARGDASGAATYIIGLAKANADAICNAVTEDEYKALELIWSQEQAA